MPASRVSRERIDRIVALPDRSLRNRWITRTYWELAHELRTSFEPDATWLSFAVWASHTAGLLIAEDGALLAVLAADEPAEIAAVGRAKRWLDAIGVGRWIDRVTDSISQHLGDGNKLVFAEIAPLFLELRQVLEDERTAQARAKLVAGAAPLLATALGRYFDATRELDAKRRAELILLANLEAVLHEQERLDTPIRRALEAVVDKLSSLLGLDVANDLPEPLAQIAAVPVRWLQELLHELAHRFATDTVLTLHIGRSQIRLADDLAAARGEPLFPKDLSELANPELLAFLARWDSAQNVGNTARGSGAEDWAHLAERMNYLCSLFRSRQQDPTLLQPLDRADEREALAQARARAPA